jgi:hypothetical protein
MGSKHVLATALSTMIALGATASSSWAAKTGKNKKDDDGAVPASISKQFEWEEKVVGPNDDKKIDHKKIAAMQAAARKDEESHKNEPTVKKTTRAHGVAAPSTSTIPTMDIEKPAAPAPKATHSKPVAAKESRPKDSLDNLLDSEKETGGSKSSSNDNPLGKVLAVSDKPASHSSKTKGKRSSRRARQ